VQKTWEGDNRVLLQQAAKFLLKNFKAVFLKNRKPAETCEFIQEYKENSDELMKITDDLRDIPNLIKILKANAAIMLIEGFKRLQGKMDEMGPFDGFTTSLPFNVNRFVVAYGDLFTAQNFLKRVEDCKCAKTKEIFDKIFVLWINKTIISRSSDFRRDNLISSQQLEISKTTLVELCKELRHEIIPLSNIVTIYEFDTLGSPFSFKDAYHRFLNQVR